MGINPEDHPEICPREQAARWVHHNLKLRRIEDEIYQSNQKQHVEDTNGRQIKENKTKETKSKGGVCQGVISNHFTKAVVIKTDFLLKDSRLNTGMTTIHLFNLGQFAQVPYISLSSS